MRVGSTQGRVEGLAEVRGGSLPPAEAQVARSLSRLIDWRWMSTALALLSRLRNQKWPLAPMTELEAASGRSAAALLSQPLAQ